jgi:hypothetical protein
MIQYLIDEIIESAKGNSSGSLVNEFYIKEIANRIIQSRCLNNHVVDTWIEEFETEWGYMIKSTNFIEILKPYLVDELHINQFVDYPDKDYELIEALYGEWHSECGDRD